MSQSPVKRKRSKTNPEYYVQPARFDELIIEYYESNVLSEELCECVLKIANKLSHGPNFRNYSYREEMVGDAVEKMVYTLHNKTYKYNPDVITKNGKKGNAFMYFSKTAYNAMVNRIKLEDKNNKAIEDYREEMYEQIMAAEEGGNLTRKKKHTEDFE